MGERDERRMDANVQLPLYPSGNRQQLDDIAGIISVIDILGCDSLDPLPIDIRPFDLGPKSDRG
jgi:hypothetical protein